jgi:ligand-binding sensor domain-containing protein/signal transduction histidine kinase/DNA-binding response OmpR family regulator
MVFLCLLCFIHLGNSQQQYFKNLSVEDGLSHNTVFAILQDSRGFMWFGTKDGLNRFDGSRFKVFKNDPQNPYSIGSNTVQSLFEDRQGKIWVGTNQGVYIYEPETEKFRQFDTKDQDGNNVWGQILEIQEDNNQQIWIASSSSGLYRYQAKNNLLTHFYHDPLKPGSLASGSVSSMTIDAKNNIWVGILGGGIQKFIAANESFDKYDSPDADLGKDLILDLFDHDLELLIGTKNGGLKKLIKATGQVENVLEQDMEKNTLFIRDMAKLNANELWICTELGIYVYNTMTNAYRHIIQNPNDPYSIADNAIYSIFKDSEGGIWVGSYFGGVDYLPNHQTVFEKYYPINGSNSILGKRVREFAEDDNGYIWVGTEDNGLSRFNPETGEFKNFLPGKTSDGISYHNIHGMLYKDGKLWLSNHSMGLRLDILDTKTEKVEKIDQSNLQNPLYDSDIFSILEDRSGNKWFGTISGVYKMKKGSKTLEFVPEINISFFIDIMEDSKGRIWFATTNNGLFLFEPEEEKVSHFLPDPDKKDALPGIAIISIIEDSQGNIWLGTEGYGLVKFQENDLSFLPYKDLKAFPSNTIYQIVEDDLGFLWVSTAKGLLRFEPEAGKIEIFTKSNGLLSDQFNYKSGFKASDGTLYFGSLNGFIRFDPKSFIKQDSEPEIVFTGLKVYNREIIPGDGGGILDKSILHTQSLKLKHDQSTLTFNFAALNYTSMGAWKYAYIMDGLEKEWNYLDQNQEISYLNLPPGKYTLLVTTVDNENNFSDETASLEIEVLPPFYLSRWAFILYASIFLALIIWLINTYRTRVAKRHKENIRMLEDSKEKEIYQAKIKFFTNITHEIRTPLTLIKGPLEMLLKGKEKFDPETKENLLIMERNSNRLINLSNQLLDFRKAEKQDFSLSFVSTDICSLVKDLHYRFQPFADLNHLEFKINLPEKKFTADIDKEEVTKILSNLISNALKNAATEVSVHLNPKESNLDLFSITVCNDGLLIDENLREKIFEPFYQINDEANENKRNGTGLGLPLSRSLAELHQGELKIDTLFRIDQNCFTLKLPIKQKNTFHLEEINDLDSFENLTDTKSEILPVEQGSSKAVILLVEDNKELRNFMQTNMKSEYQIILAENGKKALETLDKVQVDLIISDIMMPVMDGIELCKEVKSQIEFSHIPIILLTAKTTLQSKIEGMETGADVYIEKPFSLEYLSLQTKNLLEYRDKVRKQFSSSPIAVSNTIAHTKADERFLNKVNEIMTAHLSDELFGVNELAENLNMSQSSLLRKIKGIAKMTPNEYIRLFRLKKAAALLEEGEITISEVCTVVGFNSPSYFSKCFQKQFGELPRDYQKTDT